MVESTKTAGKLGRIEALLRILAFVVIVVSAIGKLHAPSARLTVGASIVLLAWIVISEGGHRLRVGGSIWRGWWVIALDMALIALAIVLGRGFLEEMAAMALMVPIGVMTLRGRLGLAILFAVASTAVAYVLLGYALADPLDPGRDISLEVIAHTMAWLAIFGMVAFSSRQGYRFLQISDLQTSEGELRLEQLLRRAPDLLGVHDRSQLLRRITEVAREVFEADSASIMLRNGDELVLAGLSRRDRYLEPESDGALPADQEHPSRVSIADFVAFSGQALVLNRDLADDPRFRNLPHRGSIRSAMSVPVSVGDDLVGVLNVSQLEESAPEFTEGDLRVARALGLLSAIALHPPRG